LIEILSRCVVLLLVYLDLNDTLSCSPTNNHVADASPLTSLLGYQSILLLVWRWHARLHCCAYS